MSPRTWRRWALAASAGLWSASVDAQPLAPSELPGRGQVIIVMPFTGNARQDVLDNAEAVVRNALLGRGARVPERSTVLAAAGVAPPTEPTLIVNFAQNMGATHAITGVVAPLQGQYNLSLTLYEVPSRRSTHQERNVTEDEASTSVAAMIDALFAPNALGPAPVDPEEQRRQEEARRAAEQERLRQEAEQRRTAAQRAEEEARRRQAAYEAAHPTRRYDEAGPFAVGLTLGLGGLIGGTRNAPSTVLAGQNSGGSSAAFAMRLQGDYALAAVRGLEVHAELGFLTVPTSAVLVGAGAQFSLPAESRSRFRATGGAALGIFAGVSGARLVSFWMSPYVRAEYQITSQFSAFAGLGLDLVPGGNGGFTALEALLGARVRFGAN